MAFMVPLVKNHYDIYNSRSSYPEHETYGYSTSSVSSLKSSKKNSSSQKSSTNSTPQTVVLNGIVLMNKSGKNSGGKNQKPKVILSQNATVKGSQQQKKQQNTNDGNGKMMKIKRQTTVTFQSTQSMNNGNSGRSFPHVRRTVRNPLTNRIYSYSVSIPEFVAEEEEEELARELAEELAAAQEQDRSTSQESGNSSEEDQVDQVMIFSTSAPAGTGNIDNGIIDMVDDDEFVLFTGGVRLPPTISPQSKKLINDCYDDNLSSSLAKKKSSSPSNRRMMKNNSEKNQTPTKSESESFESSNSREYAELLQKFILHLKMLKIKRFFNSSSNSRSSSNKNQNQRRSRTNTLDDSNVL